MDLSEVKFLYENTSLNQVSKEVRKAVFLLLKTPLEQNITDTQKSVELIESLLDYIAFLEWIFLPVWQHFTAEELKMPWIKSLLKIENRWDEKEKREILEFFREQFRGLYPGIFSWSGYVWPFSSDNPASILIDACEWLEIINTFRLYFTDEEIKIMTLRWNFLNNVFNKNHSGYWEKHFKMVFEIWEIIWITSKLKENHDLCLSKLFLSFSKLDSTYSYIKFLLFLEKLKYIEWFNFEWILDLDLTSFFESKEKLNFYLDFIEYFEIKDIKFFEDEDIKEFLENFTEDNIRSIKKCEDWFWRKITIEDLKNWTLIIVYNIYTLLKDKPNRPLKSIKIIFDYIDINNNWVLSIDDNMIYRFVGFCKNFILTEITEENVWEIIDVVQKVVWMKMTLNWFKDEKLYKLLKQFKRTDNEEYIKFFQNFPKYTWVDKKWNKFEEDWNIKHFEEDKELKWILLQEPSLEFINLFSLNFNSYSDVLSNKSFQVFYQNVSEQHKKNTVKFIKFVRKYNLFEIKLADINWDFVRQIYKNFGDYHVSANIPIFPEWFFEDSVKSLKDFENNFLLFLISENSSLYDNLSYICKLYNITVTVSWFKEVLEELEDKETPYLYLLKEPWLKWKARFIIRNYKIWFWNDIDLKTLLQVLCKTTDELEEINYSRWELLEIMVYQNEDEKLDYLCESFCNTDEKKRKFYRDLFSQKDWNLLLNRDKRTLLKLVFDRNVELWLLKIFLETFSWVTLWKLVKYYRDSWLGELFLLSSDDVMIFLTQYAIDKNDYYYLKHNFWIRDWKKRNWYDSLPNWDLEKLKTLLDKTWWFLTETFVKRFVIEWCSEEELDKLIKSYNETSAKLLWSEKIEFDEADDGMVEAIYMAYRPTTFTIEQIKKYLNYELQDNSHHLDKLDFKREWYEWELFISEKRLKNWEKIDLPKIHEIENWVLHKWNESIEFDVLKFFNSATDLKVLYPLLNQIYSLNNDYRIEDYRATIWDWNYDYTKLLNLASIFWIITKDSFWDEVLSPLIDFINFQELKTTFEKLKMIKDPKFRKLFGDSFKEEFLDDFEELKKCFKKILFEQLKFIAQRIKREIEKEIQKFQDEKWEWEKIRFVLCKNITSFFAMAWSKLCTANDVERHNEERYIPVNIIDDKSKQIVGMLMMYIEEWRDYLVIRWLNLRSEMYQKYNIDGITEAMVNFIKELAIANNYKKVYIPENSSQHLLSNNDLFRKSLTKVSERNKRKVGFEIKDIFYWWRIWQDWWFKAERLYLFLDL